MHGPINVKSPNNISKWQMGFNSAFKAFRSFLSSVKVTCYILPRPEGIKEVKQAYQDIKNK
jgi:hypothetical protein